MPLLSTVRQARLPIPRLGGRCRGFLIVVGQQEQAFRETLGYTRTALEPGVHLNVPFLHRTVRVDKRASTLNLSLHATTEDNVPIIVKATAVVRVAHVEKSIYNAQDWRATVEDIAVSALRTALGSAKYDSIICDRSALSDAAHQHMKTSVADFGVVVDRFNMQNVEPESAHVKEAMQRQMEAERRRRETEKDNEAALNTAETDMKATQMRAQGERYALAQVASGYADQLTAIASAFGGDTGAAAAYLLAQRNNEVLAQIASSPKGGNRLVYMPLPMGASGGHASLTGPLSLQALTAMHEATKECPLA